MTKDNTAADSILSAAVFVSDYFPVWVRLWVLTASCKRKPSQSLYAKGLLWVKKRIKCGSTIFSGKLQKRRKSFDFRRFLELLM
nr:hypothetical protein [uncultured Oscillibacter sp.]